jgi:hypothetical protein
VGDAPAEPEPIPSTPNEGEGSSSIGGNVAPSSSKRGGLAIDGLIYNIQIQLPESRDPKVYDALFESLAKHLRA